MVKKNTAAKVAAKGRTRIDKLTPEEEARFGEWRDRWISIGLCTGPADREKFERAAHECYRHAGLAPPKRIVWVQSPLVLAFAGPIAARLIESRSGDAVGVAVHGAVRDAVRGAVDDAVGGAVDGAVDGAVHGAVGVAVHGAVRDAVGGAVDDAVRDAVGDAVHGAVHGAVGGAVDGAVDGAVHGAVGDAVRGAVGDAVRGAVDGAVRDAVDGAVDDAVGGAVDDAVRGAVDDAVGGAVDDAVRDAVRGAVGVAVHGAVRDVVDGAVRGAVDGAVRDAVRDAVKKYWHHYMGGQFWVGGWYWGSPSYVSFFTDICGLRLSDDMMARAKAYRETCESAGWWWPHRDFVIVCERPRIISRDEQGRLHSEVGNAIEFRDGWGLAAWHGTIIPVDWIRNRKTLDPRIALTDPNVERRRAAAEIIGWARVLREMPHREIDKDTDPQIGTLISVDLPDAPDSRFVLVRCATGRDFALPVPREMQTALAANAWTYDIKPIDLQKLEVRT